LPKLSKFNNKLGIFIGPWGFEHNKAQSVVEQRKEKMAASFVRLQFMKKIN